jgi:hypothetical protein
MSQLTKKQDEDWVIKEFLPLYNREKRSDYSIAEKDRERPDFIIVNSKGGRLGLETTDYTGYFQIGASGKKTVDPRTEAGRRKAKENQLWEIMDEKLRDNMKDYAFGFYAGSYPSKKNEMEDLAEKAAHEFRKRINEGAQKGTFKIGDIKWDFYKEFNKDRQNFAFHPFPEGVDSKGIQGIKDNFVRGMYGLMWKKIKDAKKYKNQEKNILVIYNNAEDTAPISDNDLEKIMELNKQNLREKKLIDSYKEIWLLYRKTIYSVY